MEKEHVHTIDAKGKKLGRVATQASSILSGKGSTSYAAHEVSNIRVDIIHASFMDIPDKKRNEKQYSRYSGYPGGLSVRSMKEEIAKKGYTEVLRKAVYGMLPGNKLRSRRLKNLYITD
jgi:large subunit ribosomal protein L13